MHAPSSELSKKLNTGIEILVGHTVLGYGTKQSKSPLL